MRLHWMLGDDGEPKAVEDVLEWGAWLEDSAERRRVALDEVNGMRVSTVFLGLDHDFTGKGPPVLFETMVFIGDSNDEEYCRRYSTRADAINHHRAVVELIRSGQPLPD